MVDVLCGTVHHCQHYGFTTGSKDIAYRQFLNIKVLSIATSSVDDEIKTFAMGDYLFDYAVD